MVTNQVDSYPTSLNKQLLSELSLRDLSINSNYFLLHRGVRQGCCLSPYIFDIAIEPLAIALRADVNIAGIERGGSSH
jgi:hypothetical protein